MKTNLIKISVIVTLSTILSACVVAPPQPIGYRMTSPVLPTYVNGQYVGMQPSNYVAPAQVAYATPAPAPAPAPAATTQPANPQPANPQPAPVYLPSPAPSVVYVQAPQPVYNYSPYYDPGYYGPYPYYGAAYGYPWFGGIGVGIGFRVRIR